MNRNLIYALSFAALAATAIVIIADNATAAPIDSVQTVKATQATVSTVVVERTALADGGSDYFFTVEATAPRSYVTSDGGTSSDVVVLPRATCQAAGAVKTTIDGFFTGGAIKCARQSANLE